MAKFLGQRLHVLQRKHFQELVAAVVILLGHRLVYSSKVNLLRCLVYLLGAVSLASLVGVDISSVDCPRHSNCTVLVLAWKANWLCFVTDYHSVHCAYFAMAEKHFDRDLA